jgi:NTE family protein
VAGTSIGALLGSAWVGGIPATELAWRAAQLKRRDLFRLNHYQMLVDRMRAPSLYAAEPLRQLVDEVVPSGSFEALPIPLLINTADVALATQVVWGLPGLRDVPVRDAVYASCALPGFFPPGRVDGRRCIDGGTIDNLPVSVAALGGGGPPIDAVIAVDVGNAELVPQATIAEQGFASIFMRAASVMMHALQEHPLAHWQGPPMLLVRPKVSHIGWFAFGHTEELVEEGYRATREALCDLDVLLAATGGIFPRRLVQLAVDRAACTGCGLCVALAPRHMTMDATGRARPVTHDVPWSPADGDFVKHCPTRAITVTAPTPAAAVVLPDQERPDVA